MKYDKIDDFLASRKITFSQLAKIKNFSKQALYKRKASDIFYLDDLIEIGMLTDTQLVLIDKKKKIVLSFDESDLAEKELNSLNMDYLNSIKTKAI